MCGKQIRYYKIIHRYRPHNAGFIIGGHGPASYRAAYPDTSLES